MVVLQFDMNILISTLLSKLANIQIEPKKMKNYSQVLSSLLKRIVEEIKPLRVILFGSVARNTMSEESDIDLLVVMPEGTHRRHTAQLIYKNIRNIGVPFDVLVVTDRDLEKHKNSMGLIYQEILAEGIEVYAL